MKILALDLGLHCGYAWCYRQQPAPFEYKGIHAVWHLKFDRKDEFIKPLVRFKKHLQSIGKVDMLVYEEVGFMQRGSAAAQIYGGLKTLAELWAYEMNARTETVHVKTLKKWATDNGNANKTLMMQACKDRLGIEVSDDNEADAIWLLDYAIKNFTGV